MYSYDYPISHTLVLKYEDINLLSQNSVRV